MKYGNEKLHQTKMIIFGENPGTHTQEQPLANEQQKKHIYSNFKPLHKFVSSDTI